MMAYIYLSLAIVAEVIATTALKRTEQFTRFWPTITVAAGYALAFYFLTFTLRWLPVGVTYAIWSGMGVVLVTALAAYLYREMPDLPAILGMILIITGVVLMNLFSKSAGH